MARPVQTVMTPDPTLVAANMPLTDVARTLRDYDIGDVLVVEGDQLVGVVTDRDIVVRALADHRNPDTTRVGDVCSGPLVTISPEDDTDSAARLMRENSLRRLPVVVSGDPVGIVSLGDLAVAKDPGSALADISDTEPNR